MSTEFPSDARAISEALNDNAGFYLKGRQCIESGETPFQRYEVWDTPQFGKLFRLDGCFMTSEGDEFHYHENLIHVAAIAHPSPKRALIIGGGDGGSAEELFKHPTIERIVLVELDEKVLDIARKHLQAVHRGSLDDPRLEIRIEDGLRYVADAFAAGNIRFDLIVLDLTDPVGPAEALYQRPFLEQCRALLTEEGALSLHLGSPVFQPERVSELVRRLRGTFQVVRPYFLYIPLYGSIWGMASASRRLDPLALDANHVERRLTERGIDALQYYNGAIHQAQFALPNYLRALLG